jgi:serine/threonine-protein kinase
MGSFLAELKRRGVFYGAAYYAAGAWLAVQVATAVFPYLDFPAWSIRLVIVASIAGFPIALLLSWFYDWTPKGFRRDRDGEVAPLVPAGPAPANSIAVLPFVDMSPDRDHEYFSDGLSEELLNLLAQLPQLQVIARTSSFSFKGKDTDVATIARTLRVAHVLEGSVRKSGQRLRVTAQLIRAGDSAHLWSQNFDREIADVFEMQDEIAGAVVSALKVKLLPDQHLVQAHRTDSTEAYEQLLVGQNVFRKGRYDNFQRAVQSFQRAIALDPGYAAAWAGLATAQSATADFAADYEQHAAGKQAALASAERAVALAPNLADGYIVRGQLRHRQYWDWLGGMADFRRAHELEPARSETAFALALGLYCLDDLAQATEIARAATVADPLSWPAWTLYGAALGHTGRRAEACTVLRHAIEVSPDASIARVALGDIELLEGNAEAARTLYLETGEGHRQAGLARACHSLGEAEASAAALAELEAKYASGFSYQIAEARAWRGEIDAAFAWLDRACSQRDSGIPRLRGNEFFDNLKPDPRWTALLARLNFPERSTR